jgi:hypothetical protein
MATPIAYQGNWNYSRNELYTLGLENIPSRISGYFYCSVNKLTSLEGAPSSIGGDLDCFSNCLSSLHNIHKQIKHIGGYADFRKNPITSCVLGLLLIDGLEKVYLNTNGVEDIINKHLKGDRDVFACQEELIEAGYEEFTQL